MKWPWKIDYSDSSHRVDESIPRNALVWIMGANFFAILPHTPHLPIWLILFSYFCLIYRVLIAKHWASHLGKGIRFFFGSLRWLRCCNGVSRKFWSDNRHCVTDFEFFIKITRNENAKRSLYSSNFGLFCNRYRVFV